jgi:hypothetical protein
MLLAHVPGEFKALGGRSRPEPGQDTGQGTQPANLGTELDDLPVYTLGRDRRVRPGARGAVRHEPGQAGPRTMAGGTGWDIDLSLDRRTHGARGHGHSLLQGRRLQVPSRSLSTSFACGRVATRERAAGRRQRGLDSLEERAFRDWPAGTVLHKPSQASPPGLALTRTLMSTTAYHAFEHRVVDRQGGQGWSLDGFDAEWGLSWDPMAPTCCRWWGKAGLGGGCARASGI